MSEPPSPTLFFISLILKMFKILVVIETKTMSYWDYKQFLEV
jgi:hypothetical protein